MARTFGSYMIQPTKDELRETIRSLRRERDVEKAERIRLQEKLSGTAELLDEAAKLIGYQIIEASAKGNLPALNPLRLLEHQR